MEKKMVIEGMKCMHCKASVEKALQAVPGVTAAEVDLEAKIAKIVLAEDVADDVLKEAVKAKGFEPVQMI
ncbi:MAG: heavy-metal-associated domain-containing protein [Clostridia bacterium]|nr:heavy-metal-associated domain-containing protein [Clostridia bacterium]